VDPLIPSCGPDASLGVVPVLVGPLQVLITVLPGILLGLLGALVAMFKPSALKHTVKLLWRQKLQVTIVFGCLAGFCYGGSWVWTSIWPPPAASEAEAGAADWSLARGGLLRTGAVPGAKGPIRGGAHWTFKDGVEGFLSSPAVVGNRVYVSSARLGFPESGTLYCFDADTGARVWRNAPAGFRPTFSSPVIAGKRLVCGEGLHVTRDARIVCMNVDDGRVLWEHRTKSHVECTPAIWKDRVVVGAGDDGYYCLTLEPEKPGAPKVLWRLPGEKYPDAETALAVHDGKVYAGLGVGIKDEKTGKLLHPGKALCVLDIETGKELRRIPLPYPVFSPPSIDGGRLYLGLGNGDYINSGDGGEVRCFDLSTMETVWTFPLKKTVLGAVAVSGDSLYVGSQDGFVYGLSKAGKLLAKFDTHAPIATSPAVTASCVYIVTGMGMLYALDRQTLEPVWEFRAGTDGLFISSPAVARGRVYIGTQNQGLLCAGEPGERKQVPLWSGPLAGPGRSGCLDGTPPPETGALHWVYPGDDFEKENRPADWSWKMVAPAAAVGGTLCAPVAGTRPGLLGLDLGAAGQNAPKPRWRLSMPREIVHSPVIVADAAYAVDGRPGDSGRGLHRVELATGAIRAILPVAAEATGVLAATAQELLVQDQPDRLTRVGFEDRARPVSFRTGPLAHPPVVLHQLLVAAPRDPPALAAYDIPTGLELWRVPLDKPASAPPACAKDTVYLGTSAGIEARSLTDGRMKPGWRLEGGPASGPFALLRDRIVYVSAPGELVLLDRETGSVIRRCPGALPGLNPLVGRDAVLYAAEGKLMRLPLDPPDAKPHEWTDISWLGKPSSPLVLVDSCVYVGVEGWGLARFGRAK
jgi:outer membrane protein assembly factor BamB